MSRAFSPNRRADRAAVIMRFLQTHAEPSPRTAVILAMLPFVISIAAYLVTSHVRHQDNPRDRLVPTASEMVDGFKNTALEADRKGQYRLWIDTWTSGKRFVISVALLAIGVLVGLHMGLLPYLERLLLAYVTFFDKVPALALLPILFIVFGLGEVSKVALILLGVMPTITLDTYLRAKALPKEQHIKALTLGASDFEIAYSIVLPQILPQVLDTIRLNFKSVLLFLIAGESLAATVGLGYRIFLVRRYVAMNIIIPYVIWMALLMFAADFLVRLWIRKRYPWFRSAS